MLLLCETCESVVEYAAGVFGIASAAVHVAGG